MVEHFFKSKQLWLCVQITDSHYKLNPFFYLFMSCFDHRVRCNLSRENNGRESQRISVNLYTILDPKVKNLFFQKSKIVTRDGKKKCSLWIGNTIAGTLQITAPQKITTMLHSQLCFIHGYVPYHYQCKYNEEESIKYPTFSY